MYPRVKEVVRSYEKGGLEGMKLYFSNSNMTIDPSTWCGHIKKSLDEGHTVSLDMELQLMLEKFKFYKNVSEENRRRKSTGVDGEGNPEIKGETGEE